MLGKNALIYQMLHPCPPPPRFEDRMDFRFQSEPSLVFRRMALDKSEGVVKHRDFPCGVLHRQRQPDKVEDQGSGYLTLNHFTTELRSTIHRFGHLPVSQTEAAVPILNDQYVIERKLEQGGFSTTFLA
jgi:hypothetical protein